MENMSLVGKTIIMSRLFQAHRQGREHSFRLGVIFVLEIVSTLTSIVRRVLKRKMVKSFVSIQIMLFILVLFNFDHSLQAAENFNPALAVWKIHNKSGGGVTGTAFAISRNHFMTTAHTLKFLRDGRSRDEEIILSWKDTNIKVRWKRLISVSLTYDLAIFEIKEEVKHFLTFADSFSEEQAEGLYTIGYPHGHFQRLEQAERIVYKDALSYTISMSGKVLGGFSGSPVLMGRKVVAVLEGAVVDSNISYGVRLDILRLFRAGELGVLCSSSNLSRCVDKAVGRTKKLAQDGDSLAQYRFGHKLNFWLAAGESVDWLRRSADQGFSRASCALGVVYFDGKYGVEISEEKSMEWYRRGAEQEDTHCEYQSFFIYYHGLGGFPKDDELALEALVGAAHVGYMAAQYNLGLMYGYGWLGLEVDRAVADDWFRRAAAKGHEKAQEVLDEGL